MRTKLLDTLGGANTGRPPLWLMRQAGRYLPEYRALREKYDFMTLCHKPELICEVTLQPIQRYDFDAAILFSDILMIPDAMGLGLRFDEHKGPIFHKKIENREDILALGSLESLQFVAEGIKLIKENLDRPLLGFAGAPFTVASYMIEGGSSSTLRKTKKFMMRDPESFHLLLEKIKVATIDYLKMQIDAGVNAVQLFESWAPYLAPNQLEEFSTRYMREIEEALEGKVPVILFAKGAHNFNSESKAARSIDFTTPIRQVRDQVGSKLVLQGNLDPDILFGSKEKVILETKKLLESMKGDPAWIFNLGHGILPETPLENVYALRDTVFSA